MWMQIPKRLDGFALATCGLWIVIATPGLTLADTNGAAELVSFSFDEGTVDQYRLTHPDHVQDTVFAPSNAWFPDIRFLGAGAGSEIEVDALSYGHGIMSSHTDAFFSVDRNSNGLAGTAVAGQAPADREADIFASNFAESNTQIYDANGSNGAPNGGLAEPASTNIDGLDMRAQSPTGHIYWSVDRETAETEHPYAAAAVSGADIFISQAAGGYSLTNPLKRYATANDLGLTETDDIDALVVIEIKNDEVFDTTEDIVYYSLVANSTSIAAAGGPPFNAAGAADVFVVGGGSLAVGLAFSAPSLGLHAGDNLDALDFAVRDDILTALASASSSVPSGEAVAFGLILLLGASAVWILARRRNAQIPRL